MGTQLTFFESEVKSFPNTRIKVLRKTKTRYEYLILISPPYDIDRNVKKFQTISKGILNDPGAKYTKMAHISICLLPPQEENDKAIIALLTEVVKGLTSFIIYLDGFGHFDQELNNKNTFFISIVNKKDISNIFYSVMKELHIVPQREYVPHMTIGKNIDPLKFPAVKSHFENIDYEATFLCNRITLLKRTVEGRNRSYYKKVFEAPLLPLANSQ